MSQQHSQTPELVDDASEDASALEGLAGVSEWGTRIPASITFHRAHPTTGASVAISKPVSRKLDKALHHYLLDCMTQEDAAREAGLTRQALGLALKRPHIQARCKEIVADSHKHEGMKALRTIRGLRDQTDNRTVQFEASRYLVNLAGLGPADHRGAHATRNQGGGRMISVVLTKRGDVAVQVRDSGADRGDE